MTLARSPRSPTGTGLHRLAEQPITARLAGAGSARSELQILLAAAPVDAGREAYHELVLGMNVLGKTSAVTREKLWQRLKDRYVLDPAVPEFSAFRTGMVATANAAERGLVCFLMMARSDRLFREVTLDCVSPYLLREGVAVDVQNVQALLETTVQSAGATWSRATLETARQHVLSALKDFGLLRGGPRKVTVRPRPGPQTTLFAARLARLQGLTDRQMLGSCWFSLLGYDRDAAVELLYDATRAGALRLRLQADVVEVVLPDLESR